MSKSLGNLYTLDDTGARGFPAVAVRFLLIRAHYRQVVNFTWESLEQSAAAVRRVRLFAAELEEAAGGASAGNAAAREAPSWMAEAVAKFDAGMDDDLNVSAALDGVFSLLNAANRGRLRGAPAAAVLAALRRFDQVLGVLEAAPESIDREVEALIVQRTAARARKDFAAADAIRQQLAARGIELLDGKDGVKWRRTGVKA